MGLVVFSFILLSCSLCYDQQCSDTPIYRSHFSMARPGVRQHVENMLSRFKCGAAQASSDGNSSTKPSHIDFEARRNPSFVFLMLSAADILTLLNALFPRAHTPLYSPPATSSGISTHFFSPLQSHHERTGPAFQPGFFRPNVDSSSRHPANNNAIFPADMNFLSLPVNSLTRNADRIRFELSDMGEPDGRSSLDHPSTEDWAIFSISETGKTLTWGLFPDGPSSMQDGQSADDVQSTTLGIEDNYEGLQTAIVKLAEEGDTRDGLHYGLSRQDAQLRGTSSLRQRFDRAMSLCNQDSDFIGAHYWWNASRQLLDSADNLASRYTDDSWILGPMHSSCSRSLNTSLSVIERCESEFVALDRNMQRLQTTVKGMMTTVAKLRNKMWYMTDVKNSMKYEDAKHVALALKTMVYSARLFKQTQSEPPRTRNGTRSLAGSLLQKPELQVMNVMKAPSSQGGPNKLSDEQVDLTRKWLSNNGIDNFCKGEERIHRFCYEVITSVNRLVGETMSETPVLWASELFQKERAKYEGFSNRRLVSVSSAASSLRPSSLASEDAVHVAQLFGTSLRRSESISRFSQDSTPLAHKTSFQSIASDKWRSPRDFSAPDTSSIGDSPGRAASTSTAESYSTFWSAPHAQTQYSASASSLYSRPPSMFSDTAAAPPRRSDRNAHEKVAFLQEMKQTLASLLLSDLGSPVWSCGSETDAWFSNALNQRRIQAQMEKRARVQRFHAEYEERLNRAVTCRTSLNRRRSRSLGPDPLARRVPEERTSGTGNARETDGQQPFSYRKAFARLLEVFSRQANPFVKLRALRDLRLLVIAALTSSSDDKSTFNASRKPACRSVRESRAARYSFSGSSTGDNREEHSFQAFTSPAAESIISDSRSSDYSTPTEKQIVDFLRDLILDMKPKTLFRDLQFISAFVPSEVLNKTDSGTAFLQFGLAALSLKDEVCNSMVEIADKIVSQELSRRYHHHHHHHPSHGHDFNNSRPGQGIEDAAGMWIITAKEGNPVAQRELAILYLTHPELLPRVTLPLTLPRDTFKAEMMYHRDKDTKSDPQSMCLALHWMQLSANGGDELAKNRLRERQEFDSIA